MARRAFIFSLDSFVSFSLILIAIQSMLAISSLPAGYYPGLLQADFLAQDTLQSLGQTRCDPTRTCLDATLSSLPAAIPDSVKTLTDRLIPAPYSYAYSYFDFSTSAWRTVYNASKDSSPINPHYNITYHRVQASSQRLVQGYPQTPVIPRSPYCNVYCSGWDPASTPPGAPFGRGTCNLTPCQFNPKNNYDPGNFSIGILRLTVWG